MGLELASEADSEDQKPCGEDEKFYTEGQQIYNIVQDIRQSAQGGQCVPHLPESVNDGGPGLFVHQKDGNGCSNKDQVKYCPYPVNKYFGQQELCGRYRKRVRQVAFI